MAASVSSDYHIDEDLLIFLSYLIEKLIKLKKIDFQKNFDFLQLKLSLNLISLKTDFLRKCLLISTLK